MIKDEVEKADGDREIRTVVRSISQPRIIALLASIVCPGGRIASSHEALLTGAECAAEVCAGVEARFVSDLLPA